MCSLHFVQREKVTLLRRNVRNRFPPQVLFLFEQSRLRTLIFSFQRYSHLHYIILFRFFTIIRIRICNYMQDPITFFLFKSYNYICILIFKIYTGQSTVRFCIRMNLYEPKSILRCLLSILEIFILPQNVFGLFQRLRAFSLKKNQN